MSNDIDWSNLDCKISKYFTVNEATWLPQLQMHYNPSDEEKANIIELASRLDVVREFIGKSFIVNVWIRPKVIKDGKTIDYNALVGGASHSAHIDGRAVDLHVADMTAEQVRDLIKDKLPDFNLRMENKVSWVHLDSATPPSSGHWLFNA